MVKITRINGRTDPLPELNQSQPRFPLAFTKPWHWQFTVRLITMTLERLRYAEC